MTRPEWNTLAAGIVAYWPHRALDDATLDAWFADLADIPLEVAEAALRGLARDGREWPPTGGQIRAKAVELARQDPDHGHAWELVRRAIAKFGFYAEAVALDWLYEQAPAVGRAVTRFGWRELCHYDLDDEQTVRAQFREVYKAVVRGRDRDFRYAGLAGASGNGQLRGAGEVLEAARAGLEPGGEAK